MWEIGLLCLMKPIFEVIYGILYEKQFGCHKKRVKTLSVFAPTHVLNRGLDPPRPRLAKSASRNIKGGVRKT